MVSLDGMSLKSRTETSARWWQEMEGGSQSSIHISHRLRVDTVITWFKLGVVQSLPFKIIVRGLDESPMVPHFVQASVYCKPEPSKCGQYTQRYRISTEANSSE